MLFEMCFLFLCFCSDLLLFIFPAERKKNKTVKKQSVAQTPRAVLFITQSPKTALHTVGAVLQVKTHSYMEYFSPSGLQETYSVCQ
jgi:hypothetical protein